MQRKRLDGVYIPGETRIGVATAFNRFVIYNKTTGKYEPCGDGLDANGLVENDLVSKNLDDTARTGYIDGDLANVKIAGIGYVEVGEAVEPNDYLQSGDDGIGMKYIFPNTNVENQPKILKAKVIEGAAINKLALVALLNMG